MTISCEILIEIFVLIFDKKFSKLNRELAAAYSMPIPDLIFGVIDGSGVSFIDVAGGREKGWYDPDAAPGTESHSNRNESGTSGPKGQSRADPPQEAPKSSLSYGSVT